MMLQTLHYPISGVTEYINWLYFFHAWGFPSSYGTIAHVHDCPACRQRWIQSHPAQEQERCRQAIRLYDEAQKMLLQMAQRGYHTHFRFLISEANSEGDDLILHLPEGDTRIPLLRQQSRTTDIPGMGTFHLCLSDFVRPTGQGDDRMGLFASTVDAEMEHLGDADDYSKMMAQTLSDRLAEATAERGHMEVRTHWWGYAPEEKLTKGELFAEHYQGRRPAVGYPSLPDQSLLFLISRLLDFPSLGITLTENAAMRPHATTSGLMLSHPATRHFAVGKIGEDQLQDYARRRGVEADWLRRFLL